MAVEYDAFADIYDVWVQTAEVAARNLPFYVEAYLQTEGPVVELGVGNGRIAIEAARRGKSLIGVDSSSEMLARCRERAEAAGLASRLTLLQADFRDFVLPEPADLITIPFHSIGHLLTPDDKRAALRHINRQLAPCGRLVFDHFVFNAEAARRASSLGLRAEYTDPVTGLDRLLWSYVRYDFAAQSMRLIAFTDEMDAEGVMIERRYHRLSFSWIEPEQTRQLLLEAGFEIEALFGDFDRRPFDAQSPEQVWVARRPGPEH